MIKQSRVLEALAALTLVVAAGAADAAPPEGRPALPAAGTPAAPAPGIVARGGVAGGASGISVLPGDPGTPGPPPLGWPHRILFGNSSGCNRNPFPLEVIVYEDPNFTGRCAVLQPGFYPNDNQLMVRNDSITSIKVGQLVRARVFKDSEYGGGFTDFGPSSSTGRVVSDWNDDISSLRVEPAARHPNCDDVVEGEIAFFADPNFGGDCVVLPGDGSTSYATAAQLGIANDSISAIWNNTRNELVGFDNVSFLGLHGVDVPAHTKVAELNKDGRQYLILTTSGMNDAISSAIMR
jgi:hypothetical protein